MKISISTRVNVPETIMYHGTSSTFLRQILKKGLVPSGKKVWDSDPQTSFLQLPRTSLPGIYVTRNLMTAISSSTTAVRKFGGKPLIVVCNIQPKSLIVDEDEIQFTLQYLFGQAVEKKLRVTVSSESVWIHLRACRIVKADTWFEVLNRFVELVMNKYRTKNIPAIHRFASTLVDYKFAHGVSQMDKYSARQAVNGWYYKRGQKLLEPPPLERMLVNKQEAEQSMTRALDTITQAIGDDLYRQYLHENRSGTSSDINRYCGRIKSGVTYRGKNRIIAIIQEHERGAAGETIQLDLIYGSVPSDFETQYSSRVGPNFTINSKIR